MRMRMTAVCLVACSSSPPAPPEKPVEPVVVAVDAAAPDAGVPEEVANAPAWVFRYNAPGRLETWTLRYHGDTALVTVEAARGTTRYLGSVDEGASLSLSLAAGPNKLALECKRAQQPIGKKCGDTKAKKLDVLDCYHPDFKAPMTFGPAPGIEFVTSADCNGYRLLE